MLAYHAAGMISYGPPLANRELRSTNQKLLYLLSVRKVFPFWLVNYQILLHGVSGAFEFRRNLALEVVCTALSMTHIDSRRGH